jgi:hypothetical protein
MDIQKLDDLRELIGEYWCLAFAEGREGRNTDTPDGAAQKCISAIEAIIREARSTLTPPEGFILLPVKLPEKMLDVLYTAEGDMSDADMQDLWDQLVKSRPEVP